MKQLLWRCVAMLTVSAAALTVPVSAAGAAHRPEVITSDAATLHPEGVAWDPFRKTFLVGSVRHGTVSVVRPDGAVDTLVDDGVMVSTIGVHVDPVRRRVLVAYQDPGVGTRTSEQTLLKQSGLGIFDLATGRLLHRVDLSAVPGGAQGVHGANDVAIDAAGNAYVTDIAAGEIYRVDPRGRATLLLHHPDLLGRDGVGPNGIVWHPDGYLLVVRYDLGSVLRVPVNAPDQARAVRLSRPVVGGDGIALRRDGTLVVVINHLASTATESIAVLRSTDGWASARTVAWHSPWPDSAPTTAAVTRHGTYVIDGRLPDLFAGTPTDGFTIRRLDPTTVPNCESAS